MDREVGRTIASDEGLGTTFIDFFKQAAMDGTMEGRIGLDELLLNSIHSAITVVVALDRGPRRTEGTASGKPAAEIPTPTPHNLTYPQAKLAGNAHKPH